MICPDHGILWRESPAKIISAYAEWSRQKPRNKAIVIYDTMWESTRVMAEAIVDGLGREGVEAYSRRLRAWHRSDIMTDVLDAGALLVGSCTLNNGMYPSVADFLCYMKGLKPRNKIGAAFGSYGWSGEAVGIINKELEEMKIELVDPGLKVFYIPEKEDIAACYELAKKTADRLKEITATS